MAIAALGAAAVAAARGVGGGPNLPSGFSTNQRVDRLPVAADSDAIVASIGRDRGVHPDFGSGRYDGGRIGIPYQVVRGGTKRSKVTFDYAGESDRVGYPIPKHPVVESGSDRHALIVDRSRCRLYELYALRRSGGRWHAGSGAVWNLRSKHLRPAGWTSA